MTHPTRRRTTPEGTTGTELDTSAGVLSSTAKGVTPPPEPAVRPYVFREVIDRRDTERRAEPPTAHTARRTITQPEPTELLAMDPNLGRYVEQEIARARSEADKAGYERGKSETLARSESIGAAISLATTELMDYSQAERRAAVTSVIELAERVATVVMNRTPHDGGTAALKRVRQVLEDLKDPPFSIVVHPDDVDTVATGVATADATVVADPALHPGEARIKGVWSYSELTQSAAWEAVQLALGIGTDEAVAQRD